MKHALLRILLVVSSFACASFVYAWDGNGDGLVDTYSLDAQKKVLTVVHGGNVGIRQYLVNDTGANYVAVLTWPGMNTDGIGGGDDLVVVYKHQISFVHDRLQTVRRKTVISSSGSFPWNSSLGVQDYNGDGKQDVVLFSNWLNRTIYGEIVHDTDQPNTTFPLLVQNGTVFIFNNQKLSNSTPGMPIAAVGPGTYGVATPLMIFKDFNQVTEFHTVPGGWVSASFGDFQGLGYQQILLNYGYRFVPGDGVHHRLIYNTQTRQYIPTN